MKADELTSFLDVVEAGLSRDEPALREQAMRLLESYRGIPSRLNWLEIIGYPRDEAIHTNLLAFLIDPSAHHGLGDRLLRHLLAAGSSEMRARALGDVRVLSVRCEVHIEKVGRPDLIIDFTDGFSLVIEVKIDAELTKVGGVPQTRRYFNEISRDPQLIGARRVAFLFLHSQQGQLADEPGDESTNEHWIRLSWTSVERMLRAVVTEAEIPADTAALIAAFRTSIVANITGTLRIVERLRQLVSFDGRARASLRSARLQVLITELGQGQDNDRLN